MFSTLCSADATPGRVWQIQTESNEFSETHRAKIKQAGHIGEHFSFLDKEFNTSEGPAATNESRESAETTEGLRVYRSSSKRKTKEGDWPNVSSHAKQPILFILPWEPGDHSPRPPTLTHPHRLLPVRLNLSCSSRLFLSKGHRSVRSLSVVRPV